MEIILSIGAAGSAEVNRIDSEKQNESGMYVRRVNYCDVERGVHDERDAACLMLSRVRAGN